MEDSLAQILADAKRDRQVAAKKLLGLRKGILAPVDMSQVEAEQIEEARIVKLSAIISKLGFRDSA